MLVYNRLQERSAQRALERAYSSPCRTRCWSEPSLRREPAIQRQSSPDERVDYVIELKLARPLAATLVQEGWRPIEQRFARRVLLAAAGEHAWRAGLQLVSRAGVVAEAELLEFRSEVETLAAKLGATLSAPEMRAALEAARELDRTCAESDIQVALHVIAQDLEPRAR